MEVRRVVKSVTAEYAVFDQVGGTEQFTLYRATPVLEPSRELILKIATRLEFNGTLDREAYLLTAMRDEAKRLELEYARLVKNESQLNYQIGFPQLVETFVPPNQGGRRATIMSLTAADRIGDLVSLMMVREKDQVRVDQKTSAWILGKILKILAFAHHQGVAVVNLSGENILIEREYHLVSIFDWSLAVLHAGDVPSAMACADIRHATRAIVLLLGFDPSTGIVQHGDDQIEARYAEILGALLRGELSSAQKAHTIFYETVEALWGRTFHPYTSYQLRS